jgi:L-cysteine S-thiosulfotransferase
MGRAKALLALLPLALCAWYLSAFADEAQDARTQQQIDKYREMLQEGNPAEFAEARGEELWTTPGGPKSATLEQCDLGLGSGRVEGAYARLPRYFEDTREVQDAESRLVTCMTTLQAISGWYEANSDIEALVTYVAGKSRGVRIAPAMAHPEEREMRAVGEALFFRRSGPLDFSCVICHSQAGKRIRLSQLSDLLVPAEAQAAMAQWPAYRVSHGQVWTMQRRIMDCMRQMRWPEPTYLSQAIIALEAFLQKQAEGATMQAPGIKR